MFELSRIKWRWILEIKITLYLTTSYAPDCAQLAAWGGRQKSMKLFCPFSVVDNHFSCKADYSIKMICTLHGISKQVKFLSRDVMLRNNVQLSSWVGTSKGQGVHQERWRSSCRPSVGCLTIEFSTSFAWCFDNFVSIYPVQHFWISY